MKITTIDLGSNSFRVLQYDCITHQTIGEYEKTVGTADGLMANGTISNEAIGRIITAIDEGIKILQYNPKEAIAVTTQAMRIAKNSKEVIEKIKENTGITFQIIDGEKEANLTLLAIEYALKREKLPSDEFLLLDIGGGSTELIVVSKDGKRVQSFPFGIVTLTQSTNQKAEFEALTSYVKTFLQELNQDISQFPFISTAGTPTTICAVFLGMDYYNYDKNKVNGTKLFLQDICKIQKDFSLMSSEELMEKVGTGRTAYIDMGVEIFKLFFEILKKEYSIVFDDGLREGVAIDFCLKLKKNI
jgi:exopolyphosphatase/guanosine-5'-triphosphate,3'-diphosphate pyrophosphatase